jgi:hypothetical protein
VQQIIAIATFQGYTIRQMINWQIRLAKWAPVAAGWQHLGPQLLSQRFTIQIWIATYP